MMANNAKVVYIYTRDGVCACERERELGEGTQNLDGKEIIKGMCPFWQHLFDFPLGGDMRYIYTVICILNKDLIVLYVYQISPVSYFTPCFSDFTGSTKHGGCIYAVFLARNSTLALLHV